MVDALDLGSSEAIRESSSLSVRTISSVSASAEANLWVVNKFIKWSKNAN